MFGLRVGYDVGEVVGPVVAGSGGSDQQLDWQQVPQYASVVPQYCKTEGEEENGNSTYEQIMAFVLRQEDIPRRRGHVRRDAGKAGAKSNNLPAPTTATNRQRIKNTNSGL